eukprot:1130177-Amorphochlora_amoeboformis.AAC.1
MYISTANPYTHRQLTDPGCLDKPPSSSSPKEPKPNVPKQPSSTNPPPISRSDVPKSPAKGQHGKDSVSLKTTPNKSKSPGARYLNADPGCPKLGARALRAKARLGTVRMARSRSPKSRRSVDCKDAQAEDIFRGYTVHLVRGGVC